MIGVLRLNCSDRFGDLRGVIYPHCHRADRLGHFQHFALT